MHATLHSARLVAGLTLGVLMASAADGASLVHGLQMRNAAKKLSM